MTSLVEIEKKISKQVCKLREFEFAVIGGRPCRVIEVNKLGGNEWQIVARDLFLGGKVDEVMETEEIVLEPMMVRKEYILGNITPEEYVIIDPHNAIVLNMPKPPGFIGEIVEDLFGRDEGEFRVTVGRTPYEEGIVDYRLA